MSLKKDKFSSLDKKFMKFAIDLAKNQCGLTGTNPSVGCVIVKNKKILSYGVTNVNGRPHAETIALSKNKKQNNGSTLYVSLEPCSHYGVTNPCTSAIINSKIKKVNYAIEDLDFRSFKKSKKILKLNNIIAKSGLLKHEAKNLYKTYNYIKKNKKPFVVGKIASCSDLFILKKKFQITNDHSQKVSHLLRYKANAILTSYKTINNDNPKLNCRLCGLEKFSPDIIIIDKNLKIKKNSYVLNNLNNSKTYIFHNSKDKNRIKIFKKKGLKLIYQNVDNTGYFNLKELTKQIYDLGIHNLLVECGNELTQKFLSEKIFNEFYYFKSDTKIKSKDKVDISNITKYLSKNFKNKKYVNTYLNKDILTHYY